MKKQNSLTVALLLITAMSYGQGFVSFSFGTSIPTGQFAATDENKETSGFAKLGPVVDLSIGRVFWRHFGLTTNVRYQKNDYNTDAVTSGSPGVTATVDSYNSISFAVGPYYEINIGDNYRLDIKLQGGYLNCPFPEANVYPGSGTYINVSGTSTGAGSVQAGIALRRSLGKKFAVGFTVDYLTANPTFKSTTTSYYNFVMVSKSPETTMTQNISSVNLMLGFSYRFGG